MSASTGSRTRISSLEGLHADRYTIDAVFFATRPLRVCDAMEERNASVLKVNLGIHPLLQAVLCEIVNCSTYGRNHFVA